MTVYVDTIARGYPYDVDDYRYRLNTIQSFADGVGMALRTDEETERGQYPPMTSQTGISRDDPQWAHRTGFAMSDLDREHQLADAMRAFFGAHGWLRRDDGPPIIHGLFVYDPEDCTTTVYGGDPIVGIVEFASHVDSLPWPFARTA